MNKKPGLLGLVIGAHSTNGSINTDAVTTLRASATVRMHPGAKTRIVEMDVRITSRLLGRDIEDAEALAAVKIARDELENWLSSLG